MILEEQIDEKVNIIKAKTTKSIKVVAILIKHKDVLKDCFSAMIWDRYCKQGSICGIVIVGKYKDLPIILNENMIDDINFEYVLE